MVEVVNGYWRGCRQNGEVGGRTGGRGRRVPDKGWRRRDGEWDIKVVRTIIYRYEMRNAQRDGSVRGTGACMRGREGRKCSRRRTERAERKKSSGGQIRGL